jgi:Do/DeqQ family serine protease
MAGGGRRPPPVRFEASFRPARAIAAAAFLVVSVGHPAVASGISERVPESANELRLTFAPIVRAAGPAVVNIYARKTVRRQVRSPLLDDPFFRRFFGDALPPGLARERVENSLGSGVIVDADGLVVTNNHVISGADEVTVVLADRREFDATIVLADERTDLAVLRIVPEGRALPALELMDSDELAVGDIVLAIGNPFGVGQTVTSGIVSALARTQVASTDYRFFIQTDAAINPGNSGGAMVALDGRLAGINTAIFSRSGGSIGIGFAVPSNMVRVVVAAARSGRPVARPWLGAAGQLLTSDLAAARGLDRPGGVLVTEVRADSPADRAGLVTGDVILAVNGREVLDPEGLVFRIATRPPGTVADLTVRRGDQERVLALPIEVPPAEPPARTTWVEGRSPLAGAQIANLSPALADEIGGDMLREGVVVVDIAAASPARRLGLEKGDMIVEIGGRQIGRVEDVTALAATARNVWTFVFRRGERLVNLTVRQ